MADLPEAGVRRISTRTRTRARVITPLLAAAAVLLGLVVPAQASMVQSPTALKFGLYDPPISEFQFSTDGLPSPQITVNYQAWEQNPASLIQFANEAWQHGSELFTELGSTGCNCGTVSLSAIAQGNYDSYLRSLAKAIAAFGHPMLLTWDHEMNGTWYNWGPQNYSPQIWVAAWRHTYTVMHAIAPNATWVWAPNTEYGAASVSPYWPGARYVDEWGLDCYLAAPGQTFASQCGATVTAIRRMTNAPGMLAETGIESAKDRPQRVVQLVQAVRAAGLNAIVWFDKDGSYLWKPGQQAMAKALS